MPWHVWRAKILPFVPAHWFERARGDDGGPRACAQCGLPAHARCSCGAVAFCSRDCQRAGFDAHAAACTARPAAGNDAGDASDDGDELGALSRRLRAAVRAAEAAVAGEEAGPAPDDNRAEARARRARYHAWWWDDADAAADERSTASAPRRRGRRGRRRFCRVVRGRRLKVLSAKTGGHLQGKGMRCCCGHAPDDGSCTTICCVRIAPPYHTKANALA